MLVKEEPQWNYSDTNFPMFPELEALGMTKHQLFSNLLSKSFTVLIIIAHIHTNFDKYYLLPNATC